MIPLLLALLLQTPNENLEELTRQAYLDSQRTAVVRELPTEDKKEILFDLESGLEEESEYKIKYPLSVHHSHSYPIRGLNLNTEQELVLSMSEFYGSFIASLEFKNTLCISLGTNYCGQLFESESDKLNVHTSISQKPTKNTEVYAKGNYNYEPFLEKKQSYSVELGMKIKL